MPKGVVAVVKTRPESVLDDTHKVMELGGYRQALKPDTTTILKDNISWHFPFPGANTTPWQLEGTILALRAGGYRDLTCVQNKTVVTDAFKGEDLNKYVPLFKKYDIPVLFNFKEEDMKWVVVKPEKETRVLHRIYPDGIRIPDYFFGKNVVHLPTVKTHIYTDYTCAMKNAFGALLDTNRHYCHPRIHETLVDLLRIQQEIQAGTFAVADCTTAGSGPGPRTMIPVVKDLILASADQVAIDAVAARLIGFDPMEVPCIRLATENGLGNGHLDDIEIVGDLSIAEVKKTSWDFVVGDNAASKVGDLFWFGPMKPLARLMFQTPLVNAFIMGSFVYHDYIWYPLEGKKVVQDWLTNTEWGHLFLKYGNPFADEGRPLTQLDPQEA